MACGLQELKVQSVITVCTKIQTKSITLKPSILAGFDSGGLGFRV